MVLPFGFEHPAVTITGLSLYADGRVTPSPALLEATGKVLDDVAHRPTKGLVTTEDYYQVAGHNSVLQLPGESGHSGSRRVRQMGMQARLLMGQLHPLVPTSSSKF